MNSYYTKQTSLTGSGLMVDGILASEWLSDETALTVPEGEQQRLYLVPYETHASLSSFDQISNIFSGNFAEVLDHQLVEVISNFYGQLIENQESLGQEFERVLHENLWELYER